MNDSKSLAVEFQTENQAADAFIVRNLPATYGQLCMLGLPSIGDRVIDWRLQSLRKRGLIEFERVGRDTIWRKKTVSLPVGEGGGG